MPQTINPEKMRAASPMIPPGDPDHPWSPAGEKRLEDYQARALAGWLFVCAGFAIFLRPWGWALLGCACATIAAVWILIWAGAALDKMQTNKPLGDPRAVGEWFRHPETSQAVSCPCGELLKWNGALGNVGRYSMVCSCGRGHFKPIS
jgi:hypothetical protein